LELVQLHLALCRFGVLTKSSFALEWTFEFVGTVSTVLEMARVVPKPQSARVVEYKTALWFRSHACDKKWRRKKPNTLGCRRLVTIPRLWCKALRRPVKMWITPWTRTPQMRFEKLFKTSFLQIREFCLVKLLVSFSQILAVNHDNGCDSLSPTGHFKDEFQFLKPWHCERSRQRLRRLFRWVL